MIRKILTVLMIISLSYSSSLYSKNNPVKGYLFIIGGGETSSELMNKFIYLAGGVNSNILIIPNASSVPLESAQDEKDELEKLGCKSVSYFIFEKNNIDSDSALAKIKNAQAIFFTGGDQVRLTKLFLGTQAFKEIHKIYQDGGVIGGTSAGAAIMSKIMITGDELINKDTTTIFKTIQKGNVQTIEGFGFLDEVVVDQHFILRKRLNRLISVLLEHPKKLGVGIDESTAIIVKPNKTFEVAGDRTVIVFNPAIVKDIRTNNLGLFSASGIKLDILQAGQSFDLKTRKVIK